MSFAATEPSSERSPTRFIQRRHARDSPLCSIRLTNRPSRARSDLHALQDFHAQLRGATSTRPAIARDVAPERFASSACAFHVFSPLLSPTLSPRVRTDRSPSSMKAFFSPLTSRH